MIAKINTARANHGLPPLRTSPELMAGRPAHSPRDGRLAGAVPQHVVRDRVLLVRGRRERRDRATASRASTAP